MDTNQAIIIGRLTRDPEVGYTASGEHQLCNFSVAVQDLPKANEEVVHYFDCTAWGKQAEAMGKHSFKGQRVSVVGKLIQSRWNDKEGNPKARVKIECKQVQFLSWREGSAEGQEGAGNFQKPAQSQGEDVDPALGF